MITTMRLERRARRSTLVAAGAAAGLAAVLTTAACAQPADAPDFAVGDDAGTFAATHDYLAGVAVASGQLSYRMSMDMTMSVDAEGEHLEFGGTLMTGETDGDRTAMSMDLGELFRDIAAESGEPLPPGLTDDLTMEMVLDGDTLYMRAPYFAAVADMMRDAGPGTGESVLGPLGDIVALGDSWGSIDASEISPSEVTSAAGTQTADPGVYLDVIARGTDVRELDAQMVDGVATRGLAATISYGDMIEAQGIDLDDMRQGMEDQLGPGSHGMFEQIAGLEVPVEAWVDDGDLVRRVRIELDMTPLLDSAPSVGMAGATAQDPGGAMSMVLEMDFSDYGDESIEIVVPSDATDITDEYLALVESGGLGTGLDPSQIADT